MCDADLTIQVPFFLFDFFGDYMVNMGAYLLHEDTSNKASLLHLSCFFQLALQNTPYTPQDVGNFSK